STPVLDRLLTYPNTRLVTPSGWLPMTLAKQLYFGTPVDIFWATRQILPPRVHARRRVLTLYDFNYRICPETMGLKWRTYMTLWGAKAIRRADALVAISQGTATRLHTYYG